MPFPRFLPKGDVATVDIDLLWDYESYPADIMLDKIDERVVRCGFGFDILNCLHSVVQSMRA